MIVVILWEIDAPPPEALWICKMPRAVVGRQRPEAEGVPWQPEASYISTGPRAVCIYNIIIGGNRF